MYASMFLFSANVHMLLSGIAMAAEWGLTNEKKSLELAKKGYAKTNIHDTEEYKDLPELATSCVESSEILLEQRKMYERDKIFPARVIDFVAGQLQKEDDKYLNDELMALPDIDKIEASRKIMHRDLHKH